MSYNMKESATINLKHLKDHELLTQTLDLVQKERHLLTQVLHHLKEVERRRLFSDLGYQSLFEYAVKELKYSEGQVGRRIQAMRLLKELPEIEKKIESGALSLTNISQAQAYFREVKKSAKSIKSATTKTESNKIFKASDKVKILENLENKSSREGQKILLQMLPEITLPKEKERILSDNHTEIRFVVNQELKNRLAELRSLLGAKGATMNMAELIEYMTKTSIEAIKIKKFGKKRVLNEQSQNKVDRIIEVQRHLEEENNNSLFEYQNKDSKTKSELPYGAITNRKNIKNNLQLKKIFFYSKQTKFKIQQNEIAPELHCSMNATAKNNNSFKYIDEVELEKKPTAPELQCSMNISAMNNKCLTYIDEVELVKKPTAPELQCSMNATAKNNNSFKYIDEVELEKKPTAPELQCSMNISAKNYNSFKYIDDAESEKKPTAPELQCSMNISAMNNKCLTYIDEVELVKKPTAPEFICNKIDKTMKDPKAPFGFTNHRFRELTSKPKRTENPTNRSTNSRYISKLLMYQIWQRDQGQCQKCGGQSFLNVDHIQPIALGGESKLDNLRLLCFNCNQRQAINVLGINRMESYL
ncbi:MAG: HNH endonuclease [Bdellovibrionaceae bacterium]|nr:HNH endonuclease [Pseudobdellovibrionaceae bacterium]